MSGRLRKPTPPKEEPFSKVPRWLLKAVSPRAYMLYGYYAGRDFDRDGIIYVTVEETSKDLDWCIRNVKTHRMELKRAGAINCQRGSPRTVIHVSREVHAGALEEVHSGAHREDNTKRHDLSSKREEKKIHLPSENVVLEDNRTSAPSCTSQELDLGEWDVRVKGSCGHNAPKPALRAGLCPSCFRARLPEETRFKAALRPGR